MSFIIFNEMSIQKQYNEYLIILEPNLDSINILIQKNYFIYQRNFFLEDLNRILISNFTKQEIIEFIVYLIDNNQISIQEEKNILIFILISVLPRNQNVKLILNKKSLLSNEMIEKLFIEVEKVKEENKQLKNYIGELNKRIEEKNDENKIKELEKRIEKLEGFHLNNKNLNLIKQIHPHKDCINSLSTFPSGNIISVSGDKSIIIYDIYLNILQKIENTHDNAISYVEIKDENNFITCSCDKSFKLWIKKGDEFKINRTIKDAHDDIIKKVIYCSNGNLISCSWDKTIKIWNNNYEIINILEHSDIIFSILFLEDKQMLISSGIDGTKLWNLKEINNINLIKEFPETSCGWNNGLCRLNEDIIIVKEKGTNSLELISISKKEIIKTIDCPFQSNAITLIEDKGIFLIGGISNDIRIYRNDNYECIQEIKNAHDEYINGFIQLKDGSIASFSQDETIKKWILH